MKRWRKLSALVLTSVLVCAGCNNLSGKPKADSVPVDPSAVENFSYLYRQNCAGCHGPDGTGGPATPLGNPVYLAIADDSVVRKVTSEGVSGTTMPAFLEANGGMLTQKQIEVLVSGIREHWAKPGILAGADPPPYESVPVGDVTRGRAVYATFCGSCHGPSGKGGQKGSSIVDGSYLALVSDQGLRTIVIVGRPDLGAPDWRNNLPGRAMSAEDVSDVVAWLASQRVKYPGEPYVVGSLRGRGNP